jgi:hypothetical protein
MMQAPSNVPRAACQIKQSAAFSVHLQGAIVTKTKSLFATVAAVSCFALWSSSAFPQGGWQQGSVARVYAGPQVGSTIIFRLGFLDLARGNIPACSVYHDEWALDLATDSGRLAYSVVQDAVRTGRNLQVYGTGTCDITGDREDVRLLYSCFSHICLP